MRITFLAFAVSLLFLQKVSGTNIHVSGNVSGAWSADTIHVDGDIELPYGQVLTISAGSKVFFNGYFKFSILGRLMAIGDSAHPIRFERSDTAGFYSDQLNLGGWQGVRIMSLPTESSSMSYCNFKFMKGARSMDLEYGNSAFKHCLFQDNKTNSLVYLRGSGNKISYSLFSNNITEKIFEVEPGFSDTIHLENNTITNNIGIGLIYLGYAKSACILRNDIFWNNDLNNGYPEEIQYGPYEYFGFDTSALILQNSIVKGGSVLSFYNKTCFDQDPGFVDPSNRNFNPRWNLFPSADPNKSVAIDNGYYLSPPDSDSSRADIGALSFVNNIRRYNTWVRFRLDTLLGYRSNLKVKFTNLSNHVPGQNTTWIWSFGDGGTSNQENPEYTYTKAGVYTVKLLAIDGDAHRDSLQLKNIVLILPGTRINTGEISGIWEKKYSPYYIYGDVFVGDNKRLHINPGVKVLFMGSYSFDVYGDLFAIGNSADSIVFGAFDTSGMKIMDPYNDYQYSKGWVGIHCISHENEKDTCELSYTTIRDVRIGRPGGPQYTGSLKLHRMNYAVISHSHFTENFTPPQQNIFDNDTSAYRYQTAGISSIGTRSDILYNKFNDLYQVGTPVLYLKYSDSVKLTENYFYNITGQGGAIEKVNVFDIQGNEFDKIEGICLRLQDPDPHQKKSYHNQVRRNFFKNSLRAVLADKVFGIDFIYNTFVGNHSGSVAGLYAQGDSIFVNNNIFYNNPITINEDYSGAVCIFLELLDSKTGIIVNNTITGNRSGYTYGVPMINGDGSAWIVNNIVRNINGTEINGKFNKVFNNNVKGNYFQGMNNFDQPALFVDSTNGNFRLSPFSTSINAGREDTAGLFLPPLDFYGNPRVDTFLNIPDVGVFEHITQKPVSFWLLGDTIRENMPIYTFVAKMETNDPDITDKHKYTFVNIPGVTNTNSNFYIWKDSLRSATVFSLAENPQKVSIRSKDDFGAYIDSSFVITIKPNSITGITDISQIKKFISVYPNPFNTYLVLDRKDWKTGQWEIFNSNGQVIRTGHYQHRTILNLSGLSKGSYYLNIEENGIIYTLKILKE